MTRNDLITHCLDICRLLPYIDVHRTEEELCRTSLMDLGADSLDTYEMAMIVEERFNIEVSDYDIEHIITFGDLVIYIGKNLNIDLRII